MPLPVLLLAAILIACALILIAALLTWFYSDRLLLRWYSASPLVDPQALELLQDLASKAGVETPKLYKAPMKAPNAFTVGWRSATIVLGDKTLKLLSKRELAAVIAHELYHIRRGVGRRTFLAALAGVVASIPALALNASLLLGFGVEDDPAPRMITRFAKALSMPYAAFLANLASSPRQEALADSFSVLLQDGALALARAIEKTSQQSWHVNPGHLHLFFAQPRSEDVFSSLFVSRPGAQERLARLRGNAI